MSLDEMRTSLRLAEEDERAAGRVPAGAHLMPFAKGKSKVISKNIATEVRSGRPQKQAVALAAALKGGR